MTNPRAAVTTSSKEPPMSRSIFHLKRPRPKHEENSLRGIREADRRGFDEIDLDLLITKDDVIVCCHWPRPMIRDGFHDPAKKLRRTRTVASMTWAEVARLRTKGHPQYRIQRLERMFVECARVGIRPVLEPKDDRRFEDPALWRRVEQMAEHAGVHQMRGYTLRSNGRGKKRVAAMKAAGLKARLLNH